MFEGLEFRGTGQNQTEKKIEHEMETAILGSYSIIRVWVGLKEFSKSPKSVYLVQEQASSQQLCPMLLKSNLESYRL